MALDMTELQHLTAEQKTAYMEAEKMFASDFWPWVRNWAERNAAEQADRLINASTWDFNRVATGARYAFTLLSKLEEVTESEFAALAKQALEAEAEKDSGEEEANE